jgi:hypothetical protein
VGQVIQNGVYSKFPCGDREKPKIYARSFRNIGTYNTYGLPIRLLYNKNRSGIVGH